MDSWDIQSLFKISLKTRRDGYTDQYNRIFMVKLLLACTFVMGINWYEDKINCIIPASHISSKQFVYFVQSACWMQGLYVYKELRHHMDHVAYFGMPINIENDGLRAKELPCISKTNVQNLPGVHNYHNVAHQCVPMKKTFYLQYQWMPFFVGTLALLYYLPFIAFRYVNQDLVRLEDEADMVNSGTIILRYFHNLGKEKEKKNYSKFIARLLMNILIKVSYVAVNIGALVASDRLLEGEFLFYVPKWIHWSKFNNSISYDYMGARDFPKPGNALLPPFGYCEVYSSANDERYSYVNKHKFVCELSQHILYQYVFVLLWLTMMVGFLASIAGLIVSLVSCMMVFYKLRKEDDRISWMNFSKYLNYRQREYLELLKKKNINLYDEIVYKLNVIASEYQQSVPFNLPDRTDVDFSNCNGDVVRRRPLVHETQM